MHFQIIRVFCRQSGTQITKTLTQHQGRTNSVQHKLDLMVHFIDSEKAVLRRIQAKCDS